MNDPTPRGRLFRKYVVVLLVLVGGVLMASSLVELYFSYRETQRAIVRVERAKAVAAAAGIEQFLKEIEQQVRETTRTASDDPDASQVGQGKLGFREGLGAAMAEQRELDFLRVLRNVPAVSELSHLDLAGKEQLRVSRLDPDVVGSQEDFSRAPKFVEARAGKTYWSPVYFRNESEPYVTLAVPVGKYAVEVTTAEINLGAILKMVSQIEVGPGGYAYVVDSRDQLVAHPDSRMLRDKRDLSALAQVRSARAERTGSTGDASVAVVADGLGGGRALAAHAAIAPLGWLVFVERPAADAYAPLRAPIIRSVVIFVLGLGLSMLASLLLARRMVAPIRVLQEGAERIGAGRLDQPIELHTGDEIEALAGSFNRMTASLKESYEGLEQKVEARTRELAEANRDLTETLEQQTATSDILRVISQSPTDIQPVLDALAESATRLCEAFDASIFRVDGERLRLVAHHGELPVGPIGEFSLSLVGTVGGRSVLEGRTVHLADLQTEVDEFPEGSENARWLGFHSILSVPLMREGVAIGSIQLRRSEAHLFSERQVALLQTFADQAVIAIENVRLFTELGARNRDLTETLEQQTATSEILRVISQSPTDVQPVFDAIVRSAVRLCDGLYGTAHGFDGEMITLAAHHNCTPEVLQALRQAFPRRPDRQMMSGRAILTQAVVHVEDALADPEYAQHVGRTGGFRGVLAVPMLREGSPIGAIVVIRGEPGPFSAAQVMLLKTFADQAVIAVENVRLFKELEARNRDLTETLEQQTATSEILRVISGSPTDVQPVFDTIAERAMRLCSGNQGIVVTFDGELVHLAALANFGAEGTEAMRHTFPLPPNWGSVLGRTVLTKTVVHIPSLLDDPEYAFGELARATGFRSGLSVPMLKAGRVIGAVGVTRLVPGPFSEREIALLQTFADQAVIAVENVRLFKELQERTQELTRSVDELRALGEVGRAVSSSLDLETVLNTIIARAVEISSAHGGIIYEYDDANQEFHLIRGSHRLDEELGQVIRAAPIRLGEGVAGKAAALRAPVQVPDILDERTYDVARIRAVFEPRGYRSLLAVPLLIEQRTIGVLVVWRQEVGQFAEDVVNLLQTFAAQSVIAIQNAQLFREIDEKSRALEELSRNQEQLSRLSTALQEPLSLAEQLTRVLDAARQVVGLDRIYVWTLNARADGLMVIAQAGFEEQDWHDLVGVTIPTGEAGALAAVCREGAPMLFNQENPLPPEYHLRAPYSELAGVRVRSFLVIPMIARGRTVGVLAADNRASRAPIPAHTLDLLQTFAAQAAVAVENARLFQEIQEKSQQLELASKHKSQFLANMSHELRTPMNAVLGYTDLILDDIFGEVPAPIRETLERVKANGQHLLSLINDVLDLSRMEAGQLTLSVGEYAMGEVVHAVVSAVESLASGKKLAFKAVVPPDLPPGWGDERRLTQVLLNLAGNAIKFTDSGLVSIEARATGGAFVVSVSDTGPGISEADQQKIFEEFQQADSSSTRTKGGSGLGLSISRRIVELHGGRLWVESALGAGSTFHFTVPLRVERQAERA